MIHASLRALGPIENRAEGLIKTLLSLLGEAGTILAYVDYERTQERPYFDPGHSPACREYGVFAELLRTWPEAIRSLNPGASIAAVGKHAAWLCKDHPLSYGYGKGSPYEKLLELEGKVLLLGSDPDQVTLLHYAEDRAQLPNKRIIHRNEVMRSENSLIELQIEEFDTSRVVLDNMPEDYFAQITRDFIAQAFAQAGLIAEARSYLLPAQKLIGFAIKKMEQEYTTLPPED